MKTKRSIRDILSGNSIFLQDYQIQNGWHCRIIRSTIIRGQILSILVDPEFIAAGAYLIRKSDIPGKAEFSIFSESMPLLSGDEIHYFGQPIALLVADSPETIDSVEKMIQIRYRESPALPETLSDPQQIHSQVEKSIGDPEAMWRKTVETAESSYYLGSQEDHNRERLGCIADWVTKSNGQRELKIIAPSIWPHLIADNLKRCLEMDGKKINIVPTNPGVFHDHLLIDGSIIAIYAAMAAELTGKSIYLFYSGEETDLFCARQPPIAVHHSSGFDENKNALVNDIVVDINTGAFSLFSEETVTQVLAATPGLYSCRSWRVRIHLYRSNLPPMSIFHGYPATLLQIPAEIQASRVAELVQEDPLIWRQKHLLRRGDILPPQLQLKTDIDVSDILGQLNTMSDFVRKHGAYELLRKRNDKGMMLKGRQSTRVRKGMGMAYAFQPSGFSRNLEQQIKTRIRIDMKTDGSVHAYVHTAPGTSAVKMYIREIIHAELGVKKKHIFLHTDDSRIIPDSGPACLSRSLTIITEAFHQACLKLKKQRIHRPLPISMESSIRLPRQPSWDQERFEGDPFLYRTYGALAMQVELDPVTYIPEISDIWMIVDSPVLYQISQARSVLEGGITRSLDWVRGWPLVFEDGVFRSRPGTRSIRPESGRTPNIHIQFNQRELENTRFEFQNGFRDLPFALTPAAYLSALGKATDGYFDSVPTDGQMIYSYMKNNLETGDED